MISQHERYVFVGELKLYTYRNYFENTPPKMLDLAKEMEAKEKAGNAPTLIVGKKSLSLWEMNYDNSGYAEFLFRLTDPDIPDNELADRTNGNLRTAARKVNEDPAISSHVVIDFRSKHDQARSYPTCIENVPFLPRSMIVWYFNDWFTRDFTQQKASGKNRELKPYRPRFNFVAPASNTIDGALADGGVLKGVKWIEEETINPVFADKAYPIEAHRDVAVSVKNRPTGDMAKRYLRGLWEKARGNKPQKVKVTIEDKNERSKTISIDLHKNDILSNFFIAQEHLSNFKPPMAMCEKKIRKDMTAKMRSVLP